MKITYLIASIIFLFLVSSCNQHDRLEKTIVFGNCIKTSTNYYESDSIQNQMGYYPPKLYFYIEFINTSRKELFVPISDGSNDSIRTSVFGTYQNKLIRLYQVSDPLKNNIDSGDTLQLVLSLNLQQNLELDTIDQIQFNDLILDISRRINLFYSFDDLDLSHSNRHFPDSVIIMKSDSYYLSYRDPDDKGDHMWY